MSFLRPGVVKQHKTPNSKLQTPCSHQRICCNAGLQNLQHKNYWKLGPLGNLNVYTYLFRFICLKKWLPLNKMSSGRFSHNSLEIFSLSHSFMPGCSFLSWWRFSQRNRVDGEIGVDLGMMIWRETGIVF